MDFQKAFTTLAKGKLGEAKAMAANSVSGVLNEGLLRFKAYLNEASELASGIWETAASDSEALGDNFIEHKASILVEDVGKIVDKVPGDWAQAVVEAFHAYGTTCEVGRAILASSSTGSTFSLSDVSDSSKTFCILSAKEWMNDPGITDVLLVARSLSNPYPVLFKKGEQFYLNHVIPHSQSMLSGANAQRPSTIYESLKWICEDLGVRYYERDTVEDLSNLLFEKFVRKLTEADIDLTISNKLIQVAAAYAHTADTTVAGAVENIMTQAESVQLKVINKITTFWDLAMDCLENLGINRTLISLIDMCRAPMKDFSSFISTVQAKTQAIRDILNGAVNAWNTGGFAGLANYILSFRDTTFSITEEDGSLRFTDNNDFVPTQYIAGIVSTGIQLALSAAGAVLSACGYVIGAALIPVGSLIAGLINSVKYNDTETRCGVQTGETALGSIAPWAYYQMEGNYYDSSKQNPIIYKGIFDILETTTAPAYILEVPGGFILLGHGPKPTNTQYDVRKFRLEFHPSTVDYVLPIQNFTKAFTSCESHNDDWRTYSIHTRVNTSPDMANKIEVFWANVQPGIGFANVKGTERLKESEDRRLMNAICANMYLFLLWLIELNRPSHGYKIFVTKKKLYTIESAGVSKGITWNDDPDDNGIAEWLSLTNPRGGFKAKDNTHTNHDYNHSMLYLMNSWEPYGEAAVHWNVMNDVFPYTPAIAINKGKYFGSIIPVTGNVEWGLVPAKYDKATFWTYVIFTAVTTVVVAAVTIAASIGIKKWRRNMANKNRFEAEAAYDKCKGNPSPENIKAYNKKVNKNNLMSKITGGSKINKSDYWGSTDSSSSGSSGADGSILSRCTGSSDNTAFRDGAATTGRDNSEAIYNALTGSFLPAF